MKKFIAVLAACTLACGCGPENAPPAKQENKAQSNDKQKQATTPPRSLKQKTDVRKAQVQKPAAAKKTEESKAMGTKEGTALVVDYATGAIPLSIKQKQSEKIKQIEQQHNEDLQRALSE